MQRSARRRWVLGDAAVLVVVAVLLGVLILSGAGGSADRLVDARVDTAAPGRPVPPGFLGLSLEYSAIERYAGEDPNAVNPLLVELIRNVAGPQPVLRIGGDSTDWTWWPVAQVPKPPGVSFSLTPRWLAVTRRLSDDLRARLILGINLEADSPALAGAEASALVGGLGRGSVQALELGNEPELYGALPWYRTPAGQPVRGRSNRYDFAAFTPDFARIAASLPALPLAGPAVSGPGWMRKLGQFIAAEPRVRVLTLHRYPLQRCFVGRGSPHYPTVDHLLSSAASHGLATTFSSYAALAHRHGRSLRIDELNTVSCGADPAVSQTYASALWALDALFEMVRVGVDGVNIHTFPGAGYELFSFARAGAGWSATVAPEYYGLLMFAQAAPPGARLLPVAGVPTGGAVTVWATRVPGGRVRVVAVNKDARHARIVNVGVPGAAAGTLEWLRGTDVRSRAGVALGGFSLGTAATTGHPAAAAAAVRAVGGRFALRLPPASAALLTVADR